MFFYSDREVNIKSSKILNAFQNTGSIQAFLDLNLPLISFSTPKIERNENLKGIDLKKFEGKDIAIEINVLYIKKIARILKIPMSKIDCYPVLWCQQDGSTKTDWTAKLTQTVAFKYSVIKLIGNEAVPPPTTKKSSKQALKMIPVIFHGFSLPLPMLDVTFEHGEQPNNKKEKNETSEDESIVVNYKKMENHVNGLFHQVEAIKLAQQEDLEI